MEDKKEEQMAIKALNRAAKEDKKEEEIKDNNETKENKENNKNEKNSAKKAKTRQKKSSASKPQLSKRALAQQKSDEKNKEIVAEIASIAIIGLSILIIIGVYFGGGGIAGRIIGGALKGFFGCGAYILPFILIGLCIYMFFAEKKELNAPKTIMLFVMLFLFTAFLHIIHYDLESTAAYESFGIFSKAMYKSGDFSNGGLFGAYLGSIFAKGIGKAASIILIILAFICIGVFITGKSFFAAVKNIWRKISEYFVFDAENEEYDEEEEEIFEEENYKKKSNIFSIFKRKKKEPDINYEPPEPPSIRQRVKNERRIENLRAEAQMKENPKRNIPKPTVIEIKPVSRHKEHRKIELAYDEVMAAKENMEPAKSRKVETDLPSFIKNRERFGYEKFLEKGQAEPEIPVISDNETPEYAYAETKHDDDFQNYYSDESIQNDESEFPSDYGYNESLDGEYDDENIEISQPDNVVEFSEEYGTEAEIVLDVSGINSGIASDADEAVDAYGEAELYDEEELYSENEDFDKALSVEKISISNEAEKADLHENQFSGGVSSPNNNNERALNTPPWETEEAAPPLYKDKARQSAPPVIIKADEAKIVNRLNIDEEAKKAEYIFPKLEFLGKNPMIAGSRNSEIELLENSKILVRTLASFNVDATVVEISKGPAVTRYELSIVDGIKVSKILGLADNLALSLAATSIRIEAPIPGKSAVGIEIPNKEVTSVYLSEVVCDERFQKFPSKLAFGIGKDIAGNVVVTDIAKMPHMLIAGATGSGKSVCINTLITSIIYKATPDEVRLIMVDPKVVELSVYNGIPHLLIPVVTEPEKASGALNWAVHEMMERYNKFAQTSTRNLKGYNEILAANGEKKLPQIVIIIDELADLMMVAAKEVEAAICRLAQLARAAGIHLIIATQRPSVDVITGLIKANIPSRIAFAVSSGTDSRTIIDTVGAEKLLGKGDMLFKAVDMNKPLRVQGAFVTDKEVEKIVSFLKENNYVEYDEEVISKISQMKDSDGGSGSVGDGGSDELTDEVISFIVSSQKCSTSLIQRKFRLGYNRAARIVEELEDRGIIGPENGSKPREVLMDKYQMEEYFTRNAQY